MYQINKHNLFCKFLLLIVVVVGFTEQINGQNLYSRASGNFNAVNTWWTDAARTIAFGGTPGATHTLNIGQGHTITIPAGTTVTFAGLVLNDAGASGTLVIGNATATASTVTITNDVVINSAGLLQVGTNTDITNTINISGNVTVNTGGTFRNGGNGGATNNIGITGNLTNSGTFNLAFTTDLSTLTFSGTGTKLISGSANTMTVYDLSITGGTVVFGNNSNTRTLNINDDFILSGGAFQSGSTAGVSHIINLTRNLTNNATVDLTANSATNQTLIFTGAGVKTVSGSGTSTLQNVTLSTLGAANVNINKNVRINGNLSWAADGLLVVGTNDITMGSAATISSPTGNRYVQLDGSPDANSQLIRVNNNTTAGWQFLFPIGTATGGYTPLDLSVATINTAPTLNATLAAKAVLSSDLAGRMKRTFRLTVAGNSNATTFTNAQFYYNSVADLSSGDVFANYSTLWYQRESNGVWTTLTGTAPGSTFFTTPSIAQPLGNDTYYFTIGTTAAYGRTWYSYQSGNWNDPLTWTLDGAIFPVYSNPANAVPISSDNVVITSGRTVSMNLNNVSITSMSVIGTLDVLATTGHNFTTISGTGRIKIAGTADNFPAGTATSFADNVIGGTVEINGTGISLNAARTFNNLIINMAGATDVATLLNNITLNGNLTITNGLLQFNDNVAAVNRNLTVNGNVTISSTGGIRTGTATNTRHEFNLYGDFTNGGTAYFTNRTSAITGSEATDGIVDVNFLSGSRNQTASCNGVTRFYRIEIVKGVDETYKLTLVASAAGNFNLFGAANYDINEANATLNGNSTNLNALGLNIGTVEIGSNVTVNPLNTTGNYAIYENAALWVNGGSVTKPSGVALVPYGRLRVSAGSLNASVGSGVTLRDNGIIEVSGGTVTAQQIRTSTLGVGSVGSYIQSGGNVNVTGGAGISVDFAVFSLTYPGNVFNMSGGTLQIDNRPTLGTANARGAIFVNSDAANISVTGGTVIMNSNNAINYRITSRAPFWNVTMRGTGGARTLELIGTTSGTGGGANEPSLAVQPLVVLNDFTIENNATFITNSTDVTAGGNFEIQNGGTYTHGTNTTTITGAGVSSLTFGNTGATQTFNNLTINKTNSTDEVVIASGNATALRVNATLSVQRGVFDYASFIASVRGTVTLASAGTVGKSTSTGRLLLDGTTAQTLNSSAGTIHNLEINNSNNVTLATGNLTVLRTLTLTTGVFNINTLKLTLNGSAANIAGSSFSATKMIQCAGNPSDGGLEMYLAANGSLTYPIGVSGKYTPVTATFTSFSDDGLININPVQGILQTTNLSGGADILSYYWKVNNSSFTTRPVVVYTFVYAQTDVGGTETNYFPGKVLDNSPFTRSSETPASKVNTTTNVITFNGSGAGFTLEDANYTAGGSGRFTGTVNVYYTRTLLDAWNTPWNTNNLWTLGTNGAFGVHDSRQTGTGTTAPGAGDVAVIGWVPWGDPAGSNGNPHGVAINTANQAVAEIRFTQMRDVSNNPTARVYFRNFQFRPTLCLNNLGTQGSIASGAKVSGEGMFWNRSTGGNLSDPTFAGVDLGDFNSQDSSYMVYESTLASATYNNMPSTFPNLMMVTDNWGAQDKNSTISNNITVNGSLELLGDINLILPTGATGDITVNRNLRFFRSNVAGNDSGDGGELRFGNTGTARNVTVFGNLILGNGGFGSGMVIRVGAPDAGTVVSHNFNLYGDFIQNTTGNNTATTPNGNGFKGGTNSTFDRIQFNLLGSNSMTLTRAAGDNPQFYSLTVNKGTSIATTATFNSNFTIDGPTNLANKPLLLQNGLFVINNAAASIVLTSGGGDFNIPSSAGLEVRAGAVSTTTTNVGANITLSGLLRISGGTATIDAGAGFANDIEYSNTGTATIEVTSTGSLTVGGQIRRGISSTTGSLIYNQTGGTVVVGNRGVNFTNRGMFEVLNPSSQFNHSGGSFTLVRGNTSTTVPSLWLEPSSSNVTAGSTITIGNASTPAGTIGLQSTATLNNLTISGFAASTPTVSMYISPLTLAGSLTIASGNTLNAQGLDLSIGGSMAVNGTYTSGNNTTTFTNTGAASISGTTPALSFFNFTKTSGGILTLARDITVNRDLVVSNGTLATATFAINLLRNAQVDGTVSSTGGSGLIFGGSSQQQLTRSVAGTGTLGIVTINNASGVIIPDGNSYDFSITSNLRLQSGVFDIGGSLLSLGVSALITPVNAFSVTNMIQTNSSYTDKGVRKQFPTNYLTNFVFPVGQLYYTPVTFDFASPGNTTGATGTPTITIRPSNRTHPAIIDPLNALKYYWVVGATNVANTFRSTMSMQYVQPLVAVANPNTEADYIAARILSDPVANPTLLVNKFSTAEVNEVTNVITFNFTGVTQDGIAGDYFAGTNPAIPNNLPIYTTIASGNVDAAIYSPVVPGGGAPSGAKVIVDTNHTLTLNVNAINLYQTQINPGATLVIPSGSFGHSLGTLSGTGDLQINSNTGSAVMPAAVYDTFLSCAGGGLIFGGTGSYEVLGGINLMRNLTLIGAGSKSLANNDITICNNLTINAGSFTNANNRVITIQNDFLLNSGSFNNQLGTLTITRDLTQTAGTFDGGTGGTKTIGRNLTVNGGSFTPGSGNTNVIRVNGNMTVAGGATITTGTGGVTGQRFVFGGTSTQTLTGTFTSARAFNRLEINNTTGLTVVGNTTINSELLLTAGNISNGTNVFLMESSAIVTPTAGQATSFVTGKVSKVLANGESFTFPIGKGTRWRSGSVNNVAQTGSVTWDMEYIQGTATGAVAAAPPPRNVAVFNFTSADASVLRMSTGEYWRVSDGSATSNGRTAIVGVSWGIESDVSANLAQREAMKVMSWNGANWTNNGGTNFQPGGSHTQARGTFESTAALSFSENIVILGSTEIANPLPVTLLSFKGQLDGSVVMLSWETASELNNDYFEVERSADGFEFAPIGKVAGKGTTNSTSRYYFEDESPVKGNNYYRLKQFDYDGKTSFSNVVVINYDGATPLGMSLFPNPTNWQNINLKLINAGVEDVAIRIIDLNGKTQYQAIANPETTGGTITLKTNELSSGLYIVELVQGTQRVVKRLLIKE